MILGIDASNLRTGGSITHLTELLRAADPEAHGFSAVVVWGARTTLTRIDERPWLRKRHHRLLDGGLARRSFWQRFRLSASAREEGCDALFVPGGSFAGDFRPIVTMSRNMLPFEWQEIRRYGVSRMTLKLLALRWIQSRSYLRADGIIFLTRYALDGVMRVIGSTPSRITTVPHGVDARFMIAPRAQRAIDSYSFEEPLRLLYVSTVDSYKHHDVLARAVASLRSAGLPVAVDFVGGAYGPAKRRLDALLQQIDPQRSFVHYHGPLPHAQLHATYANADLCVFASSCENMPNVLLEGMAGGLPIACSQRGPMPEILGDAGVYFDPEDVQSVSSALQRLIESPQLRDKLARASSQRAAVYSWQRCARDTLAFIAAVGAGHAR
jgi:glycosyltransferase involved in cell wall biosynthesis